MPPRSRSVNPPDSLLFPMRFLGASIEYLQKRFIGYDLFPGKCVGVVQGCPFSQPRAGERYGGPDFLIEDVLDSDDEATNYMQDLDTDVDDGISRISRVSMMDQYIRNFDDDEKRLFRRTFDRPPRS